MSVPVRLVLAFLAAVRLLWWLVNSDGLFGWLEWLRIELGCYEYDGDGDPKRAVARFFVCPYCMSSVCAVMVSPMVLWPTAIGDGLLICLGLAGALVLALRWRQWQT